jgi:hypothetical protein
MATPIKKPGKISLIPPDFSPNNMPPSQKPSIPPGVSLNNMPPSQIPPQAVSPPKVVAEVPLAVAKVEVPLAGPMGRGAINVMPPTLLGGWGALRGVDVTCDSYDEGARSDHPKAPEKGERSAYPSPKPFIPTPRPSIPTPRPIESKPLFTQQPALKIPQNLSPRPPTQNKNFTPTPPDSPRTKIPEQLYDFNTSKIPTCKKPKCPTCEEIKDLDRRIKHPKSSEDKIKAHFELSKHPGRPILQDLFTGTFYPSTEEYIDAHNIPYKNRAPKYRPPTPKPPSPTPKPPSPTPKPPSPTPPPKPKSEPEITLDLGDEEDDFINSSGFTDPMKTGRWRLQNKMIHLTYHYQPDQAKLLQFLRNLVATKDAVIEVYSIVNEFGKNKGEENAHPHVHVAIKLDKSITITNCRFFDYKESPDTIGDPHPNIQGVKDMQHWNYLCNKYFIKEGEPIFSNYVHRIQSKKVPDPTFEELQACKTEADLVKFMADRGQSLKSGPALTPWEKIKPPQGLNEKDFLNRLREWQNLLVDIYILCLMNNRFIAWLVDQMGSIGKTVLCKHLRHVANTFILSTTNAKDAYHAIGNHIRKNGYPEIIVLDIARTTDVEAKGLYAMIEKIKDGEFIDGKYNSETVSFPKSPFIIVFSNTMPVVKHLTMDRWLIMVPNWSGERFDISFEGESGKKVIDDFIALEHEKEKIALELGEIYVARIPFKQRLDVQYFEKSSGYIDINNRRSYWERGIIPVIKIACHPDEKYITAGKYIICIEEQPMTPEELEDYKKWELKFSKGLKNGFDSSSSAETEARAAWLKREADKARIKMIEDIKARKELESNSSQ